MNDQPTSSALVVKTSEKIQRIRSVVYSVPPSQLGAFHVYPPACQADVIDLLKAMGTIATALKGRVSLQTVCRQLAGCLPGYNHKTLQAKWRKFEASEFDWHVLINRAKYPACHDNAPFSWEFRDYIGKLIESNQRKDAQALRRFLNEILPSGEPIPGVKKDGKPGTWRDWWREFHPEERVPDRCPEPEDLRPGLTVRNLRRIAHTSRAERTGARIGTSAMLDQILFIPGTREGVRPFEYVFFDDLYHDREVMVAGFGCCRLLQFGAQDYATGKILEVGMQPELTYDDGTRERLKERYMRWIIGAILKKYGFPEDYVMHLVVERGTATLRPAAAYALWLLTGGRVKVCYSTMTGQLVAAWEESSQGNYRAKAPLESMHNLFHNFCASLRGQIGRGRDGTTPQSLAAKRKHAEALQRVGQILPPATRAELGLPFSDLAEGIREGLEIWGKINDRTEHEMEGFEVVPEWRPAGSTFAWQSEAKLLADIGPEAFKQLTATKALVPRLKPRMESPTERMARLCQQHLVRDGKLRMLTLPDAALVPWLEGCNVLAEVGTEREYVLTVTIDGQKRRYIAADPEQSLSKGTKVLGWYHPFDLSQLILTIPGQDANDPQNHGGYIATWKRWGPVRRGDAEGLSKAIAVKRSYVNHLVSNIERRHADEIDAEEKRLQGIVRALVSGRLLTADEVAAATEAGLLPSSSSSVRSTESQPAGRDPEPPATTLVDSPQRNELSGSNDSGAVPPDAVHGDSESDEARNGTNPTEIVPAPANGDPVARGISAEKSATAAQERVACPREPASPVNVVVVTPVDELAGRPLSQRVAEAFGGLARGPSKKKTAADADREALEAILGADFRKR